MNENGFLFLKTNNRVGAVFTEFYIMVMCKYSMHQCLYFWCMCVLLYSGSRHLSDTHTVLYVK